MGYRRGVKDNSEMRGLNWKGNTATDRDSEGGEKNKFGVKVKSSVWDMQSLKVLLEKFPWQLAGGDDQQAPG